jgi:tetratricopeptide (TPR) repeat protein
VHEASILAELGKVLPAVEGFGDPALLELYLRARRLHATGDDATSEFMTMAGLLLANLMQRKPEPAEELSRELVEMAANHPEPSSRVIVEMSRGAILYHRGDLAGTIEHADRSLAVDMQGVTLGPIDQRCTALMMSGAALWQAGQMDEGLARAEQALEIARAGTNPFNIVLGLQPLAAIHHWRGDAESARRVTVELSALAEQQGISQAVACGELIEAWALLESGELQLAERKLEKGLYALRTHGTMMQTVYLLAVAVEVLVGLQRGAEARAVLGEAQARIEDGDARWWEPELHRWGGVLLAANGGDEAAREAEGCLQRGLEIAAMQGSEALRLRGAISLVHLAGRDGESMRVLGEALKRVHGGEGCRDVAVARELLGAAG